MTSENNFLQQFNAEQASVVERVKASLVQIHNGRRGFGAGIVWRADGIIVTNAHVTPALAGGARVRRHSLHVKLSDGRTVDARVLAQDSDYDIAALRVEAMNLHAIEWGDSKSVRAGQRVFALGHPWGVPSAVTSGEVLSADSQWIEMRKNGREWVVVSLRLRPGNSGGPLVDARGRLLGINTMIAGLETGMAVPVHVVKRFMEQTLVIDPRGFP